MAKGKQQHAHGAVTPKEWEEVRELLNGDLFLGPFDHSRSRKALDAVFAKRPASYTLEQIMSAGETVAAHISDSRDRADFRMHLNDVYARLQPKPKTVEERLAEIASKYAITLDEKDRAKYFTEIITALKENEANNG